MDNEKTILTRIASGNAEAFDTVYRHYHPLLFPFVIRYVKSETLAEDLVQEVFLKIWERRATLTAVDNLGAYLFVTARNLTLNFIKRSAQSREALDLMRKSYQAAPSTPGDETLTRDYLRFLEEKMEALPARSKEIFRLCRDEGHTYEEVAQNFGISRNAVKNHMVSVMKLLRASLKRDLGLIFLYVFILPTFF